MLHRYYRNGRLVAETTDEELELYNGIMMLPQYDEHEIVKENASCLHNSFLKND